jgi:hypothetical protein
LLFLDITDATTGDYWELLFILFAVIIGAVVFGYLIFKLMVRVFFNEDRE